MSDSEPKVYVVNSQCSLVEVFPLVKETAMRVRFLNAWNREQVIDKHTPWQNAFTDKEAAKAFIKESLTARIHKLEKELADAKSLLEHGSRLRLIQPREPEDIALDDRAFD